MLLVAVLGLCSSCTFGRPTPLEELIGMPTSASRHRQLADLYERKAADARAQAARHMSIAASYRDHSASAGDTDEAEAAIRRGIVQHCEALVRDFEDAAARYEAMAANHRTLADMERQTPPRERRGDEPRSP